MAIPDSRWNAFAPVLTGQQIYFVEPGRETVVLQAGVKVTDEGLVFGAVAQEDAQPAIIVRGTIHTRVYSGTCSKAVVPQAVTMEVAVP